MPLFHTFHDNLFVVQSPPHMMKQPPTDELLFQVRKYPYSFANSYATDISNSSEIFLLIKIQEYAIN